MGDIAANNARVAREFRQKLEGAVKDMNKRDRRRILKQAALPIEKAAASLTPKSTKVHYRYDNKRVRKAGERRSPRGVDLSKVKNIIYPGNLRRSISRFTFRKSLDAFVGPRWGAAANRKEIGRNKGSSDGYYARMVFGSATAFSNRVLRPAAQKGSAAALRRAAEIREKILLRAKQRGLNVR